MQPPRGKLARAAVFVVTVLLVVAGTAVGPYLSGVGGQQPSPANYSEYEASELVPERSDSTGQVSVERRNERGLVVIDRAHSNRFTSDEIQPLVDAITDTGYRVEFLTGTDSLDAALSRADAFVVIDPGTTYSETEAGRVGTFVERGGRLVMMGEPRYLTLSQGLFGLTVSLAPNRLSSLSSQFGIEFGADYLYNMRERDGNFRNIFANPAGDGPVVEGVDRAAFYTATEVTSSSGTPVLVASNATRSSRGDDTGQFNLAVRQGNVLAVGDTGFLERANYNVLDNEQFTENVVSFLVGGERERTLLDYPAVVEQNPLVSYTSPDLLDAAQRLGGDLRAPNQQPTVALTEGDAPDDADVLVTTYDYLRSNDAGETGISVSRGEVSVPGYESDPEGVVVVRAPAEGRYDLVIAADTAGRAYQGVKELTEGNIAEFTITNRTAVIRTAQAEKQSDTSRP